MRTVSFKSILEGVAARRGQDVTQVQAADQRKVGEFITSRVREGWEYEQWPELVVVELRRFRAEWTAQAYAAAAEVYHTATDKYWVANATTAGSDVPGVSAKWDELTTFERYVSLDQASQTPIGEVLRVMRQNPRTTTTPGELEYAMVDTGILPDERAGTGVYVEFRKRPPVFSGVEYDNARAYLAGEVTYYATTGECYKVKQGTTGNLPTNATYWEFVPFPYILAEFVKRAAAADAWRAGGDFDKADAEEVKAYNHLLQAADSATAGQGQFQTVAVRTY